MIIFFSKSRVKKLVDLYCCDRKSTQGSGVICNHKSMNSSRFIHWVLNSISHKIFCDSPQFTWRLQKCPRVQTCRGESGLTQKYTLILKITIFTQSLRNLVKMSNWWAPHFEQVWKWLGKNHGFKKKHIYGSVRIRLCMPIYIFCARQCILICLCKSIQNHIFHLVPWIQMSSQNFL